MRRQRVTYKSRTSSKANSKFRLYTLTVLLIFAGFIGSSSFFISHYLSFDPLEFYMNLANPNMKLVYIPAGLRREEIAEKYQKVLAWNEEQVKEFMNTAPKDEDIGPLDGYFMPGSYWVNLSDGGDDVAFKMLKNFNKVVSEKVLSKQTGGANSKIGSVPNKINMDTAIRIASLIQREAAGGKDMKIISGIIWNRLFSGMSLEIDATLQYAKGTEEKWWPKVVGKDKYIDSPFNTYKHKGLPPTAIANPGVAAIDAAYNPVKTDCIFYIHDNNRGFHCTKTYEAHKENVQRYLIGGRK